MNAALRRRAPGHTLAEVVVASGIFAMFMGLVSGLFIWVVRATDQGERRGMALQQARNLMYRLTRELRTTSSILDPGLATLRSKRGTTGLVLETLDGKSRQLVAYRLQDVPAGQGQSAFTVIQRSIYENDYFIDAPETQRPVAASVRAMSDTPSTLVFHVGPGPELSTVYVELSIAPREGTPVNLRTRVTMRRSFFSEPDFENDP